MSAPLRLVLMRHAKSDWSFNEPDHARPLNARGRKSAEALGDWLRAEDHLPDQVLCSTSTRTRETLELLRIDAPTRFEDRLYHADPDTVLRSLQGAEGARVLVLGHNPGFQEVAQRLVSRAPDHPRFADYPTGATLVAEFDAADWSRTDWGTGRPAAFVVPRDIARI